MAITNVIETIETHNKEVAPYSTSINSQLNFSRRAQDACGRSSKREKTSRVQVCDSYKKRSDGDS